MHRRPKVAVLATGDELVMPGATPGPGQIVYSNGYAIRALARAEGAETIDLGIAADTIEATTDGIRRARDAGADILITMGGASVGDHDLVKRSLEAEGVAMAFWRIAMRPGKPMMHGRLGAMRVIGLPGNPVSSYVCGFLFLVPLIRALSGRADIHHVRETALLGRDLAANDQREDYLRARLGDARGRRAGRGPGQPPGLLAAWKSRCGTGTSDTSAVCAGGARRARRSSSCACPSEAPRFALPAKPPRVHLKLSGCGTCIEHIVSVHDLFRGLVSTNGSFGLPPSRNRSDSKHDDRTLRRDYEPGECSRCLRANSTNFCVSSTNG